MFTQILCVSLWLSGLGSLFGLPQPNETFAALQPISPTAAVNTNLLTPSLFPAINFSQALSTFDSAKPSVNATPCTCSVFMSGQFKRGSTAQPTGYPALIQELPQAYACNALGQKTCINKCLDAIVKHLPQAQTIICGTIGRDCHKERAHLFVKNCDEAWVNSNLSAGREYCCKDNIPYTCPLI